MKKKILGGLLTLLLCLGGTAACNFNFEVNIGGQSSDSQSDSSEELVESASSYQSSAAGSSSKEESSSGEENSSEGDNSSGEEPGENSSEGDNSSGEEPGENSSEGDNSSGEEPGDGSDGETPPEETVTTDMSIHFLYLGRKVSGDCTLIKVGNTEVLIDAGATRGSVDTIVPYIKEYCTDGVLEYVIATHAHEDHIAGFVGEYGTDGVFSNFVCETIIDYTGQKTNSGISKDYKTWRDKEVEEGATHYTALECWNETNGAKRSYTLGESITLNILYQKYYEQPTSNENDYSVCVLLSQNDNHYLFTGDLESGGEDSLVESNDLPKCKVYKGGHHGSRTSSSMKLLNVIQPEIVCVCSCCGDKNGFVHQEFIDNVAKFTDKVYVTTYAASSGPLPLNGNIVVSCLEDGSVTVNCSNNNLLFKETAWFKENRTLPSQWREEE